MQRGGSTDFGASCAYFAVTVRALPSDSQLTRSLVQRLWSTFCSSGVVICPNKTRVISANRGGLFSLQRYAITSIISHNGVGVVREQISGDRLETALKYHLPRQTDERKRSICTFASQNWEGTYCEDEETVTVESRILKHEPTSQKHRQRKMGGKASYHELRDSRSSR